MEGAEDEPGRRRRYPPCHIASDICYPNPWWAVLFTKGLHLFFRSPQRGAETSIYAATSPDVEGVSGRYFMDCRETSPSRAAQDVEAARRLWGISVELTGVGA